MPYEHATPQPPRPVSTPAWVHRGLLVLAMALMTVSLVSDNGIVRGLTIVLGAVLASAAVGVVLRRRSSSTRSTKAGGAGTG